MKKGFLKKFLAASLALTMVASLIPLSAFAVNSAGDITKLVFFGNDLTSKIQTIATTANDESEVMTTLLTTKATVIVPKDQVLATRTAPLLEVTRGTAEYKVIHVAKASVTTDLAATKKISDVRGLSEFKDTSTEFAPIADGDMIVVLCGKSDQAVSNTIQFLAIEVLLSDVADGTLTGNSTVESVVLNVRLPSSLDFALNPLQLGSPNPSTNQITTTNYEIANKTGAPVQVTFELDATATNNTSFVDSADDLEKHDPDVTTKNIYFAALGSHLITLSNATFAAPFGDNSTTIAYDITKHTLAPMKASSATSAEVSVSFVLQAATGNPPDTMANNNNGIAAYEFYAEMDTYANWKAGDVTIAGSYRLTPLSADTVAHYTGTGTYGDDDYVPSSFIPNTTANYNVQLAQPIPLGFTSEDSTPTASEIYTFVQKSGDDLVVPFNAGANKITSITRGAASLVQVFDYAYDGTELTVVDDYLDGLTVSATPVTFTITLDTEPATTYTLNVEVQQAIGFVGVSNPRAATFVFMEGGMTDNLAIPFNADDLTITAVTNTGTPSSALALADLTLGNGNLLIKREALNNATNFATTTSKEFTITLSDSSTCKLTIVVTQPPTGFTESADLTKLTIPGFTEGMATDLIFQFSKVAATPITSVTVKKNGSAVTGGTLVNNTDYTLTGRTFTIKQTKLATMNLAAGVYTVDIVISGATYTLTFAVAPNVPAGANAALVAGGTAALTMTRAAATAQGSIILFLSGKPASVTELKNEGTGVIFTQGTHFTYNASTGFLTITPAPAAATGTLKITAGTDTYLVDFNFT